MTLPAWSFSMLEKFEQCPRAAYYKYILKEKEPETLELIEGRRVHEALEKRIKGTPLPEALGRYEPMAASVVNAYQKGAKVYTELKMGLSREMKACGFFDKHVWGRSAADVVLKKDNKAIIFDWKTGKKREKDLQLLILALFTFKHFPTVKTITGCNLWLLPGDIGTPYAFTREQESDLWVGVLSKIYRMEKAFSSNVWPEQPSGLCGYCPVKQCQYNKR